MRFIHPNIPQKIYGIKWLKWEQWWIITKDVYIWAWNLELFLIGHSPHACTLNEMKDFCVIWWLLTSELWPRVAGHQQVSHALPQWQDLPNESTFSPGHWTWKIHTSFLVWWKLCNLQIWKLTYQWWAEWPGWPQMGPDHWNKVLQCNTNVFFASSELRSGILRILWIYPEGGGLGIERDMAQRQTMRGLPHSPQDEHILLCLPAFCLQWTWSS